MRRFALVVVAVLGLSLTACGADGPNAGGGSTTADEPAPIASEADGDQLYEVNATVLADETQGPMLCLGAILTSLPPQCGNVPIANWDWRAVAGEERVGDTIWGSYHLVGTFDGTTFTVTEVGPYEDDPSAFGTDPDMTSPCEEPTGGWVVPDPAHNTQNEVGPAAAYARSQPDYAAFWVTHLKRELLEFSPVVVTVVFTGDAERHEAELRKLWDGPLCVVARDVPTARELARIRKEVEAGLDDLGLEMLWSGGPSVESVIEIGVVADVGGKAQTTLDACYGPGVVRLFPALKPVS